MVEPDEFYQLVCKNRSYRKFKECISIDTNTILDILDTTRYIGCAANSQHIKYKYTVDQNICNELDATINWAAWIKDWTGHIPSERPSAFILITSDPNIRVGGYLYDIGIAAQTITLSAAAHGLGCCMIGGYDHEKARHILNIPQNLELHLLIALGVPDENVQLTTVVDGNTKYYRTAGIHYVPKRELKDIII